MMLPEHVTMLREIKASYSDKSKPILDEQHLAYLNQMLDDAIREKIEVEITYYWKSNYESIIGVIERIDIGLQNVRVVNTTTGGFVELKLENIIDVNEMK